MKVRQLAIGSLGVLALLAAGCSGGGAEQDAPSATRTRPAETARATSTEAATIGDSAGTTTPTAGASPPAATATAATATPTANAATAPPPAPTSPLPTSTPAPSQVLITVRAFGLAFDRQTIHVPANATVVAVLQNDDEGVEHNLSFSLPGLAHGDTCKGPCNRTQTFTAPPSGSFFFLCTLHDMSGTVVVDS